MNEQSKYPHGSFCGQNLPPQQNFQAPQIPRVKDSTEIITDQRNEINRLELELIAEKNFNQNLDKQISELQKEIESNRGVIADGMNLQTQIDEQIIIIDWCITRLRMNPDQLDVMERITLDGLVSMVNKLLKPKQKEKWDDIPW